MSLARRVSRLRPQPKVRIVCMGGDSSVVGRGSTTRGVEDTDLLPRVWQYTVSTAVLATHQIISDITPLHHPDSVVPASDRIGPGESCLRATAKRYPNDIILGVPNGVGGTAVATSGNTWDPTGAHGGSHANYDAMITSLTAAIVAAQAKWPNFQIVFEMVYWNLGPNDVAGSVVGADFYAGLQNVISTFRTTSMPSWANVRWVLAGLTPTQIPVTTGQQIERAIMLAVANIANVYYVKGSPDETADGDTQHADPGANRTIGRAAALIDLDPTPPVWPGLASYANAASKKLQIDFGGDFAVVGTITSSVVAVDSDFEIGNIYSANRTLRWNADGTKTAGSFTANFTVIGGNRVKVNFSVPITVSAAGGINLGLLIPAGIYGFSFDPARQTTADQSQDNTPGTTAVALNSVVGRVVDDSPNALVLTQATTANKPLLHQTSSVWNWEGDGTNDILTGVISGGFGASRKGTCVLLVQSSNSAISKGLIAEGKSVSGAAITTVLGSDGTTGTSLGTFYRNDASASISGQALAGAFDGSWHVVTVQWDFTTALFQIRIDGGAWTTKNIGNQAGPATVDRLSLLGFQGPSTSSWMAAKIGGTWGYADYVREGLLAIAEQNYANRAGITLP